MAGDKKKKRQATEAQEDEKAAMSTPAPRKKRREQRAEVEFVSHGPTGDADAAAAEDTSGGWRQAGKGKARGSSSASSTAKPSSLKMLRPKAGRSYTLSVAIPASIVENCQSFELKAMLVGQLARAFTIFAVDEVVLFEDQSAAPPSKDAEGWSRGIAFMVRNLQYLETPQYLRRQLLPMHPDLRHVGLLSPLDAPHHLRKHEWLAYREGVVLNEDVAPAPAEVDRDGKAQGSWLNCGLSSPVWVSGQAIPPGVRVTVQMDDDASADYRGVAVPPHTPRTKAGLYWGYQTRLAKSLKAVFDGCPFQGGYDLSIGTSERGEALGVSRLPKFNHLLLAFGGLGGFEEVIRDELSGYEADTDPGSLFSRYVNVCPNQTSRTIRTEEALFISLAALSPHLPNR